MPDAVDISYALSELKARQPSLAKYHRYYHGDHDLAFSSDAFRSAFGRLFRQLVYNRCRAVIDQLCDRLKVVGWDASADATDEIVQHAQEIWAREHLATRQTEVMREALRAGDAYLLIWADRGTGKARIYINPAHVMHVVYDEEEPDRALYAVKCWQLRRGQLAGHWRVNVYDATVVQRFVTANATEEMPTKTDRLIPYEDDEPAESPNPWGIMPVVHFANDADTGCCGRSELADVIPLQDGLNKSLADMLVTSEFAAYPQRWVIATLDNTDPADPDPFRRLEPAFRPGIDRIWNIAPEPGAAFGQFDPTDQSKFTVVQDAWDIKIARVSAVPVHWLTQTSVSTSGESLRVAEAPFVSKIRDRQAVFSGPWHQAMALALVIEGHTLEETDAIEPVWQTPESRSDREIWELAALKRAAGVPLDQVLREAGYTEEEIAEFARQRAEEQRQEMDAFAQAFDAGEALP